MLLSSTSIRAFAQNENPDNTGFRKPGASKSGGLSLRTPFKDRSVNSVSPNSKCNSKFSMRKQMEHSISKNIKCAETLKFPQKKEKIDVYSNDYASFKEVDDNFADIFPSNHFNMIDFLSTYISGCATPKYLSDDEEDEPVQMDTHGFGSEYSPVLSPVVVNDVALPVFQFDENF